MSDLRNLSAVYIVRSTEPNNQLLYSLRSLDANLPHADLAIVGYRPQWVSHDVRNIPGNRWHTKPRNVYDNIAIACNADNLTDDIIVMNDDFFIMQPIRALPPTYRCTLDQHIAKIGRRSDWLRSLIATKEWLANQGIKEPLSYELHRPVVINRAKMAEVLALAANHSPATPPQWRTIYGNYWDIPARRADDTKIYKARQAPPTGGPHCSTANGDLFARGDTGKVIRDHFPTPSRYEQQ